MKREYHKWYSHSLNMEMEMLVYGHSGARVILFPTRTARFFDYENWKVIHSISEQIENGNVQVFALDSKDHESFYCRWAHPSGRIQRHIEYEKYIIAEVLPFTRLKNSNPFLVAAGCSMGAYHAVNVALRYPNLFGKVVALSGRYDLTNRYDVFADLFDGYFDDHVYFHMPSKYMPNMPEGELLKNIRQLQITIACGRDDSFAENNRQFSNVLNKKGIKHEFFEWDGLAHSARFWRQMLPMYL